ncbi:hypothetical protein [Peribacillus sp. SCS-155]|uniref:hypothetical protein n=1 Tax=Peribacillus sedimenti TaxID=3115297 RepID=UPI0039066394
MPHIISIHFSLFKTAMAAQELRPFNNLAKREIKDGKSSNQPYISEEPYLQYHLTLRKEQHTQHLELLKTIYRKIV